MSTTTNREVLAIRAYCDSIRYPEKGSSWLRPME